MVLAFNSTLSLHRMIKDAKKEKGQDDFLGNVVLKLKVFCITFVNTRYFDFPFINSSYQFLPQTYRFIPCLKEYYSII